MQNCEEMSFRCSVCDSKNTEECPFNMVAMYAIAAECTLWNNEKVTLVSQKKFKTYEEARKKTENYIESIPTKYKVVGYKIIKE